MKYIAIFLFISVSILHSHEANQSGYLRIGDTVRPLKPQSKYPMRVYVFTDRSNCALCMHNIERFYEKLREYPIEYLVFLNGYSQADAEQFRKEENIEFPIVGDEFQIYRNYYRIRNIPLLVVLDNVGKVLAIESPTSRTVSIVLDSLRVVMMKHSVQETTDLDTYFQLLWTLPVRDTSERQLKSGWARQMLVAPDRKSYILVNGMQCMFYVLDSTGRIRKRQPIHLDSLDCMGIGSINWLLPGKRVLIFGGTYQYPRFMAQYSLDSTLPFRITYIPQFVPLNIECYYCYGNVYFARNSLSSNRLLVPNDTSVIIIDNYGHITAVSSIIDSIYYVHHVSNWLGAIFGCYRDSLAASLFQFGRMLRIWDKNANLVKTIPLNFSDTYRVPTWDIPSHPQKPTNSDEPPTDGRVSNLAFRNIYFDSSNGLFLVPYRNTEYPPGIVDNTDARVQHREYLHFCREDGSPVFDHDLFAGNHFIPHDFRDGILVGTVLDANGYLTIVAYALKGGGKK